ncbi:hypothetical protein CPB83DRAFT_843191 [Crepidotus variabilis]|uniref:Uncharacterized protein n=1 Tax=Crepidotus variabilis TaxID=179855 RepID=A0A9P6EUI7_9AGAR|nr:hypothetical protein CPB83DRAFT_843191 [Crepidotus variabilis]
MLTFFRIFSFMLSHPILTLPIYRKVRIHFFKDYRNTKHLPQEKAHSKPDVRIDLSFDPRLGIDLKAARKTLGAESLAIITDGSPFRRVFDPVSQDRLSPVATYDLSKHFAEPIRVYEPNVSSLTRVKRTLYESLYLILSFVFILIKSMLGFPLADPVYTCVTYGETFTFRCCRTSQMLRPLNQWASEGVWLFSQAIGCLLLLPFALLYQSAKGIKIAGAFIATHGVSLLTNISTVAIKSATQTIAAIPRHFSTFAVSVSGRGWLAILALSWFTIAEFKASVL